MLTINRNIKNPKEEKEKNIWKYLPSNPVYVILHTLKKIMMKTIIIRKKDEYLLSLV